MPSVVFSSSSISPTNSYRKRGNTVTASFYQSSGSLPGAGSSIQSVVVSFSDITVYSQTTAGFSTNYFEVSLDLDSAGSQTQVAYSVSSALLNFTGGSITFTVWGGVSSTSNVLNVRTGCTITITVNYSAASNSTGYLSASSIAQGSAIGLTLNAYEDSYCHIVRWSRDSTHAQTQYLDAGISYTSMSIPTSWPTGTAYAQLETYTDDSYSSCVGTEVYSFTITVDPASIVPTAGTLSVALVQPATVPSNWDVYVKGYSTAKLTLSGSSPGSGSSYKNILLSCGSQQKSSQSETTFTTNALMETGMLTCKAKITNAYGNAASATDKTITVYDYFSPIFASLAAYRCTSNGTPSDTGAYISVTASVTIASVNGKNSLVTLQAQYAPAGSDTWSTAQAITNGSATIIGGSIGGTSGCQVRVTAIDGLQNQSGSYSQTTVTALTSDHVIFCMDGGLNVSVGMQGTRQRAVQINGDWDIYHGATKLNGTIPISRGGTSGTTAAAALYNLINALSAVTPVAEDRIPFMDADGKTAGYVTLTKLLTALGFSNGILPLAKGGTGSSTAEEARSNLGITPANIGAAATSHSHSGNDITSGQIDLALLPFKCAWGTTYVTGVSWASVSYSSGSGASSFSSTPVVIVSYGDAANGSSAYGVNALKTQAITGSNFQVCMSGGSGSGSREVHWIAIGT